jgi:AcrR family transcriptional regulator
MWRCERGALPGEGEPILEWSLFARIGTRRYPCPMSISPSAALDAGRGPAEHDVRTQIIEAATAHFSHYGYDKTTVSDLAKAIGFSKAYIYKFFASKQAIGEVICANCLAQIESDVHAALQGVDAAPDRLRVLFTRIAASMKSLWRPRRIDGRRPRPTKAASGSLSRSF